MSRWCVYLLAGVLEFVTELAGKLTMADEIQVIPSNREVIERTLLTSIGDGEHVAVVTNAGELQMLIDGLRALAYSDEPVEPLRMADDLERLKKEAFG